jgi:hypothetical protein
MHGANKKEAAGAAGGGYKAVSAHPARSKQQCQLPKDLPNILPGGLAVAVETQRPAIPQLDGNGNVSVTGSDMAL